MPPPERSKYVNAMPPANLSNKPVPFYRQPDGSWAREVPGNAASIGPPQPLPINRYFLKDYNDHNPDYLGFTADTNLTICHDPPSSGTAVSFTFRGNPWSSPVMIRGVVFQAGTTKTTVEIAENPGRHWHNRQGVDPSWGRPNSLVDPDRFDHVTMRVEDGGQIGIRQDGFLDGFADISLPE
jgi:hypothetical protein